MDKLTLYPLSVILSFLSETDGTSFLISKKRFSRKILPMFRLPQHNENSISLLSSEGERGIVPKHRHKFVVAPVQDSTTLLDRVNTKRLFLRKLRRIQRGLTLSELALEEWSQQSVETTRHELLRFISNHEKRLSDGVTLLVSYPRSGNTLVRSLLEAATGIVTGSDTRADRNLSIELAQKHGLVGEGVVQSNRVQFVKSHWPERMGCGTFDARKAILLVRNPYDAIDSYWNMNATMSHTQTVIDSVYSQYRQEFENLVENDILVWLKFIDFWVRKSDVPVLIVRFEDLIADTKREMIRMIEFTTGEPISSFWESRVDRVTSRSVRDMGSYKPRAASGLSSVGKSLKHYSDDLLRKMQTASREFDRDYLFEFGYSVEHQKFPENFQTSAQTTLLLESQVGDGTGSTKIRINAPFLVRRSDCPYGRLFTKWRHSVTENDTKPLPTVSKS